MTLNRSKLFVVLTKHGLPIGTATDEDNTKAMIRDWDKWREDRAPHRSRPADLYWRDDPPPERKQS